MAQNITNTAQMQCDKGLVPTKLVVTSQNFVRSEEGNLAATEGDKTPNINIMPFGICAVTQKACVPAPTAWKQYSPFTIEAQHELTMESSCPCSVGGTIRFTDSGHGGYLNTE